VLSWAAGDLLRRWEGRAATAAPSHCTACGDPCGDLFGREQGLAEDVESGAVDISWPRKRLGDFFQARHYGLPGPELVAECGSGSTLRGLKLLLCGYPKRQTINIFYVNFVLPSFTHLQLM